MTNPFSITKPKRLFAFGCSFTDYWWPTWADVLAYDLDVPLYNYGRIGAGNQFIFNHIVQADGYYKFTPDDFVMVSWTNVSREDRFINGNWHTVGNIFTQSYYDKDFVRKYADVIGYAIKDFASMTAAANILSTSGCSWHFTSMCNIQTINQWDTSNLFIHDNLLNLYRPTLDLLSPSFYKVLWQDNFRNKYEKDQQLIDRRYQNGHPTPLEHLEFLEKTFSHIFCDNTRSVVQSCEDELYRRIRTALAAGGDGGVLDCPDLNFSNRITPYVIHQN